MASPPYAFNPAGRTSFGKAPAKKPPAKPPVVPKAPGKPAAAKPATGSSPAQQIVQAMLQPYLDQIRSERESLTARQQQQQQNLRGFSEMLISYLKDAPTAIAGDYRQAVDSTEALARASADRLLASNPNSLDQGMLAAINAPQAQRDALAQQNQNVYGGGSSVLYHTAGTIPATAFAQDAAAAKAFADTLPSIQGLSAQRAMQALLSSQGEETGKLDKALADLLAKQPKMVYDVAKDMGGTAAKPIVRNFSDGTTREYVNGKWVVRSKKTDSAGSVNLRYTKDAAGNLVVFDPTTGRSTIANPPGWVVKKASSGSSGSKLSVRVAKGGRPYTIQNGRVVWLPTPPDFPTAGGTTQDDRRKYTGAYSALKGLTPNAQRQMLNTWAKDSRELAKIAAESASTGRTVDGKVMTYQRALKELMNEGVPLDIAQKALNAYWKPGENKKYDAGGGRPKKSFQARTGNPLAVNRANQFGGTTAKVVSSRTGDIPRSNNPTINKALQVAMDQLGKPYVWGAESPDVGFDCSGLIEYAFEQAGIRTPGRLTTWTIANYGKSVKGGPYQPGDMILTNSGKHVVLYVGGGKVIAAPRRGEPVQIQPLFRFDGQIVDVRRITAGDSA